MELFVGSVVFLSLAFFWETLLSLLATYFESTSVGCVVILVGVWFTVFFFAAMMAFIALRLEMMLCDKFLSVFFEHREF